MSQSNGILRLYGPSLAGAAVLVPFIAYYVGQVNQQRHFQNDQAFRALASMTRDLEAKLDGHHKTLRAADAVADEMALRKPLGARSAEQEVNDYLRRYLPEADSITFHEHQDSGSPLVFRHRLVGAPGQTRIEFGLYHRDKEAPGPHMLATVPLPKLTEFPAVGNGRKMFELVVLADASGKVLSTAGSDKLHLDSLDGLITPQDDNTTSLLDRGVELLAGPGKAPAKPKIAAVQWKDYAHAGGRVTVVAFGDAYEMFVGPTAIVLDRHSANGKREPVSLVLAGLARRSTLDAAATSLPAVNLVTPFITLGVLLAFFWPIVKLHTMSPMERLTRRGVARMGAGVAIAAFPLSLLFLEAGYWITMRHNTDGDLQRIGSDISRHFHTEVARCLWVLRWHLDYVDREAQRAHSGGRFLTTYATRRQQPTPADLSHYPFFQHLVLAEHHPEQPDSEVRQMVKYSMDRVPTPMLESPASQFAALQRLLRGSPSHLRMENKKEDLPFALHPFVSPSTGEQLTLLAARWADIAPPGANRSGARLALLTSPMLSLVDPVLPDGFGFAVVDRQGQVLYHSDSSRNLRENFFEECTEPQRIRSLVESHASLTLDLHYDGEGVRLHVRQLAGLARPLQVENLGRIGQLDGLDWSLIVFRRTEPVKALFMEAGVLFLLAGTSLVAVVLIVLAFQRCVRQAAPVARRSEQRRRLWPRESARKLYRREIVLFGGGLLLIYALTGPWMPVDWPLHLPLGLLAVVAAVCGLTSISSRFPRWLGRPLDRAANFLLGNRMNLAVTFSLRAVVLVGFLVVGFGMALFQACLTLAQHNQEKVMHVRLLHKLEERELRAQELARATGWGNLAAERLSTRLDIYDPRADRGSWDHIVAPLDSVCSKLVRPYSVSLLRNLGEAAASALRTASADGSAHGDWQAFQAWPKEPERHRALSPWPVLPWMRPEMFPESALLLCVGVLLAAALFSWVLGVVQQLFLVDKFNPDPLRWRVPEQLRTEIAAKTQRAAGLVRRELILSPPRSGTTKLIRSAYQGQDDDTFVLDIAVEFDADLPDLSERREKLVARHRHTGTVVIDNFEWRFNEEAVRMEVLRLTEGLVYSKGPSLHIFSSVDPVLYVEELAAQDQSHQPERVRWTRVLGGFHKVLFDLPYNLREPWQSIRQTLEKAHFTPAQIGECGHVFRREFAGAPLLRRLAKDAAARVCESPARFRTPEQFERFLIDQARDLADEYFRMLWSLTTPNERLVLYQLAMDGWMNPLNETAIAHLVRKRMIVNAGGRQPYELFSEAFRQFVKQNQDRREAAAWSDSQRESSWHGLRVGLITLVVLFLIWLGYVRQDLFDRYVGYVVTMAGGSAALLRVFLQWFGKKEKLA